MSELHAGPNGERETIDRFHLLWYENRQRATWRNTTWLGRRLQQCPTDLWVYQELIHRVRPDVFIEVGVKSGGLTHYVASLFDLLGAGRVIGVDIDTRPAQEAVGSHPRVALVEGSSTEIQTWEQVSRACSGAGAMVLLDSDHSASHVARELELYHRLVPVGSYIIVNDTNIGGHPALSWKDSSPWDAVHAFVAAHPEFEIDRDCEKHMLTQCPEGYLRRVR